MRTQYCRIKIVEGDVGKKCKVSPETISDIKKVLKFVEDHPDLQDLATRPIKALMKIPDSQEREKATSSVGKAVKSKKNPNTGKFTKRVTESDVLKTIEKVVPSATPFQPRKEPDINKGWFTSHPGSIPVTDRPPQPSLGAQLRGEQPAPMPTTPAPAVSQDPVKAKGEEMNRLADALLELMPKSIQLIVTDVMREHPSYKVKDVFYYGIEALAEQKNKR